MRSWRSYQSFPSATPAWKRKRETILPFSYKDLTVFQSMYDRMTSPWDSHRAKTY